MTKAVNLRVTFFYWIVFLSVLLLLLFYSNHYIEFTDLAFHLLHVSQSKNIKIATSSYFLYLEIIYNMVGGQIAFYRQISIFILLVSAIPFLYILKKHYFKTNENLIFPLGFLATLTFYARFILTPNYNWVCFIGLILFAAGSLNLLGNNKTNKDKPLLSGILIGLSGWVCFTSKPTTAAAIALVFICLCLYIVVKDKKKIFPIFKICTTATVTLLSLISFHFSLLDNFFDYKERLLNDLKLRNLLGAGYSLLDQFKKVKGDLVGMGFNTMKNSTIVILFFLSLTCIKSIRKMIKQHIAPFLIVAVIIIVCYLFFREFFSDNYTHSGVGIAYGIALVSTFTIYLSFYFGDLNLRHESFYSFPASFLLIITYCFKLGSNINYILFANMSGLFFLFAALLYLKAFIPEDRYKLMARYFVAPLFALIFIGSFIQNITHPYDSDTPVYDNNVSTQISQNVNDILNLDKETHFYISGLRDIFFQNDFEEQTILIDMTGATPLASYIVNAKTPSFPWLIGGYSGSLEAASFNLNNFTDKDKLRNAWIIIPTTQTSRAIDPSVLKKFNLDFPRNYTKVSEINFPGRANEIHAIWRPE